MTDYEKMHTVLNVYGDMIVKDLGLEVNRKEFRSSDTGMCIRYSCQGWSSASFTVEVWRNQLHVWIPTFLQEFVDKFQSVVKKYNFEIITKLNYTKTMSAAWEDLEKNYPEEVIAGLI